MNSLNSMMGLRCCERLTRALVKPLNDDALTARLQQWLIASFYALSLAGCGEMLQGAKLTSDELKTELTAGCRDTAKLSPFIQDADCTCAAEKVAASYPNGMKYESFTELASMIGGNHAISKQFQTELSACTKARKETGIAKGKS